MDVEGHGYFWIVGVPVRIQTGNLKSINQKHNCFSPFAQLSQTIDDFQQIHSTDGSTVVMQCLLTEHEIQKNH
jgi:hypothetical protein